MTHGTEAGLVCRLLLFIVKQCRMSAYHHAVMRQGWSATMYVCNNDWCGLQSDSDYNPVEEPSRMSIRQGWGRHPEGPRFWV